MRSFCVRCQTRQFLAGFFFAGLRGAWLLAVAGVLCLLPASASGQSRWRGFEIANIIFDGNSILHEEELRALLQSQESPGGVYRYLSKISEDLGGKIHYFDPLKLEDDYQTLKQFYLDQGFFHSRIDTLFSADEDSRTLDITFKIDEGLRSIIDTVRYEGLEGLAPAISEEIHAEPLFKKGDPFIKQNIIGELRRVITTCFNYGYINVLVDTAVATRYASTNNYTIRYAFRPGKQYRVGAIAITCDSASQAAIDSTVLLKHIDLQPGELYSELKRMESERNLSRLGIFENFKLESVPPAPVDSIRIVPIKLYYRTRTLKELTPELGFDDNDNTFNFVFGAGFSHRNFFGDARNFSFRVRVRMAELLQINYGRVFGRFDFQDSSLISKVEVVAQLVQPYFFSNKVNLTTSLSTIIDKQKDYYTPIINAKVGVAARYSLAVQGFADWTLEWIRPKGLYNISDSVAAVKAGELYQPQFNSILTLSFQHDGRNDLFDPSKGYFRSISLEESGLLPTVFGSVLGSSLPYSRYVKLTIASSWYWDPSETKRLVWATHVRAGIASLYGGSNVPVPINRRFYAGGSSSVRGWRARSLMSSSSTAAEGMALFETGIEARWHAFRGMGDFWYIPINKLSFVLFFDAGNVWDDAKYAKTSDIAIAQGIGFRWDTVAGPVRIDMGWRVYDPNAEPHKRWITNKQFFKEMFQSNVFHLAIGHAF